MQNKKKIETKKRMSSANYASVDECSRVLVGVHGRDAGVLPPG